MNTQKLEESIDRAYRTYVRAYDKWRATLTYEAKEGLNQAKKEYERLCSILRGVQQKKSG